MFPLTGIWFSGFGVMSVASEAERFNQFPELALISSGTRQRLCITLAQNATDVVGLTV
jgi:hypothetical protein